MKKSKPTFDHPLRDLSGLHPRVRIQLVALVTHLDGEVTVHPLATASGGSYQEFADNFQKLLTEMADLWPQTVRAQASND